jgi:hypothetical protein
MSKKVQFVIPDIKTDKPLAKSTFANYKVYLNQLASLGFKDVDDLIKNDKEVVECLKEIYATNKPRLKIALFAIFYVLKGTDFTKKENEFYKALQDLRTDDEKKALKEAQEAKLNSNHN